MPRCFAAILLSPEVRDALAAAMERLRPLSRAVAWVPPENLHVTLRFLGEQPQEMLPPVVEALGEAATATAPFAAGLRGLGAFPGLDRPRILWVGLADGAGEACDLQARVEDALAARGFGREARAWHPHLTVGRVFDERRWRREAGPALRGAVARMADASWPSLRVDTVALMRSDLSPGGARYRVLATLPLGKAGPAGGPQS